MQLTSKRGRLVDLTAEQAEEFQRIAADMGECHARSQAFSGLLYTQLGSEGVAARRRAKERRVAASREQRRQAKAAYLRFHAAWQGLLHTFPELHPVLQKRILWRNRAGFYVSRFSLCLGMPAPPEWKQMDARQQEAALEDARQILARLNSNDWRRIREKMSQENFERMINFAGPEVLAALL
jgi:hypothetical protein